MFTHHRYFSIQAVAVLLATFIAAAGVFAQERDYSYATSIRTPAAPAVPTTTTQNDRKYADDHFVRGSALQMQGKLPQAIAEFRRALRLDTTSAAYFAIARCYRLMNRLDSAVLYSARSVQLNGKNIDARNEYAELLAASGEWDSASVQYRAIVERDPDNAQARFMIARIWQRRNPALAIEHYEYIRKNLDENYEVLLSLAELYLRNDDYDNAADVIRHAIAIEPDEGDLYRILAGIYMTVGKTAEAQALVQQVEIHSTDSTRNEEYYVEQLARVIERLKGEKEVSDEVMEYGRTLATSAMTHMPESWRPRLYGGMVYYYDVDSTLYADSLIASALADSSAMAADWLTAAELFVKDRQYARAVTILSPSAERFMNVYQVPLLLSQSHFALGALDSAEKYTQLSLDARQENAKAWSQLARIYDLQGRIGPCDMANERALFYAPEDPEIMNQYAYSLARRGARLELARDLAAHALKSDTTNPEYLMTVGWVYFKMQNYPLALDYLTRASTVAADPRVFEHLGDLHQALGNAEAAEAAYARALQGKPADPFLQQKLDLISQAD